MSHSVRGLPKKSIKLMTVNLECRHHSDRPRRRRGRRIEPLLPPQPPPSKSVFYSKPDHHRQTHLSHKQQQQQRQQHPKPRTSAVKFLAKMAILILANHHGGITLNATLASPSSQHHHHQQQPHIALSSHNRSSTGRDFDRGGQDDLTTAASLTNEIHVFEWPRTKNHSKSGLQNGASPPLALVESTTAGVPYELERISQPTPADGQLDGHRADLRRAPQVVGARQQQQTSRPKQMLPNRTTNSDPFRGGTGGGSGGDGDQLPRQTALVRLAAEPTRSTVATTTTTRQPATRVLEDLHTNSSISRTAITNKSARSVHSGYYLNARIQPRSHSGSSVEANLHRHNHRHNHQLVDTAESKQIEHNPECALILKRTYILKHAASTNPDEWGDKFVFNEADPDDVSESQSKRQKKIHKTDLCIKHSDVDKAVEEAKHRIKFEKPADLGSFEVGERSLASIGELNLATGLLLTKRFDLSNDEIMNALPMIDMSSSKVYWNNLCPKHVQPMVCMKSRYRTITGHCNNLKHPSWGASKTPYSRYLPPDYADGLSAPRAAHNGQPLPSARLITSVVHQDSDEPSHDYSVLFADWGQLLNHDITRVAVGEAPDCCPQLLKGLCMPIPVPPNDPLYSKFNVKCLKFERSLAAIRPKCLLGHRAQINLITSPVDASFVYGSTKQHAQKLRAFSGGKMKTLNWFEKHKLKPLLPAKTEEPDKDCVARPKNLFCFEAGDVRVNEQTHLTVLHTIYLREHNRIAKQLAKINMEWDDDKLYHETRHIVAACVQHVMVNEFLPLLLGEHHVNEYKIKPAADGFWNGYDPSVTISTGTAFASAAFRYGHSMIEGLIRRLDPKSGLHIKSELLRHLFKRPFWLYEPGAVDQLVAGMLLTPAEQTDPWVSEELSGHLFQPPKAKFGHDLAAINIQRGRDQGVPGYNDWREWCGLKRAKSFDDLEPLLMHHTAMQYAKLYKHVDDIDLWSAGISERKLAGSAVGPTMACIIARQFLNYKRGDRFWYENPNQPSSFTAQQLREIKKMSLARILCTNADEMPRIQPWAMRLPHPIYNAKVPCESLPTINLKFWDSNLMDNLD